MAKQEASLEKQIAEPEQKSYGLSSLALGLLKEAQLFSVRTAVSERAGESSNTKNASQKIIQADGKNLKNTEQIEFSSNHIFLAGVKVRGPAGLLSNSHDRYDHPDDKIKPHNPNETVEENTFNWRGNELHLRTRNGVAEYFKDADGNEWTSKDGNGWSKQGGLISETFQSKINFDAGKQEVSLENPFGNHTVYKNDGSVKTSFSSSKAKEISFTRTADGKQIVSDGEKTWISGDGKNWISQADKKQGAFELDENGRLLFMDSSGVNKIEKQSEQAQAISDKMTEMEKRFTIKLGRPGEQAIYHEDNANIQYDLRLPTMEELKVTEAVLIKFAHVAKKNGTDFGGLSINFAASKGNALSFDEHGWHEGKEDGLPPKIGIAPRDFVQTSGYDGMEGTMLHELTHQLQELEWINKKGEEKIPPQVEKFFGFEKVIPPLTNDENGTFRLTDAQGQKWQYDSPKGDVEADDAMWYPVENGKIVMDAARGLDSKALREKLAPEQRPATSYFFNPAETHAEAISMYLYDRRMLHDTNPKLYDAVKTWDQKDINYRYGFNTREDGQIVSKMIRSAYGNVVHNTSENRRAVRELEESWAKSADVKTIPLSFSGHRCARC